MESTRRAEGGLILRVAIRTACAGDESVIDDSEVEAAFRLLIQEWNVAERRIKKAEHVRAGEVVASAIFELRYAGRKVMDAVQILLSGDWKTNEERRRLVLTYLADATEDCVKAKHDAIDSMLDFSTRWFYETERILSLGSLVKFFPDYVNITSEISEIQENIAASRENRIDSRDGIYDDIESTKLESILSLFQNMRNSHKRVTAAVRKERCVERFLIWCAIIGTVLGVVGIAAAYWMWKHPIS